MTLPRIVLAAALVAIAPASARAQHAAAELRPGSPELDGSRVFPRTDTFAVAAMGDERVLPMAFLELRTTRTAAAGVRAVSRVERMRSLVGDEIAVDSFTLVAATLLPLSYGHRGREGEERLAFEGLDVRGERASGGTATPVAVSLAAPVFLGNSMDVVLSALPLAEGRVFRWQALGEAEAGVDSVEVRVAGRERLRTFVGGSCDAWRVETRAGGEAGVYWVERRTGELLQYESGEMRILIFRHRACPARDGTRTSHRAGAETPARTAA